MRNSSQAAALRRSMDRKPVQIVAVCSGKGGVGKTNVAANMAVALGSRRKDVCLLDADLSLANVDVLLGLQPRYNLAHVIRGETDLCSTVLDGPHGIQVVPASSGSFRMTDLPAPAQAGIIQAFSDLRRQPDVLIVDTAAGISPGVARFVQAAQHAIVVVCDEPASITDAYALIKVFSQHYGVTRFHIVTNQCRTRKSGDTLFSKLTRVANKYLDVVLRHIGNIPRDDYLVRAVQEQRAVVDAYPLSPSGEAFQDLARQVSALRDPRGVHGGIQFFFERLLTADQNDRGMVA